MAKYYSQLKKRKLSKENNKINNLPDKKIQNIGKIIKMLTELGKRIATNSEYFNKELENMKKDPISNE